MKKAQSMPINLVVIIGILIVTMIIVLYIFQHGTGVFKTSSQDCGQQGGIAVKDNAACAASGGRPAVFLSGTKENPVCCIGG